MTVTGVQIQVGALQNTNFQSFIFPNGTISACYLNASLGAPCEQGSIPPIGIDARSVEDVQAGVRFAAEHNLRLVIKNTGHDYLGRSTGRNSFMIWTHHLKNITYDDAFVPVNSTSSETYKALTLGAGVQWHEAYDAAEQNGRVVVGGISAGGSVGAAGGWALGGGHSALAPSYGLGVDNALQFTVVIASGEVLTANAYSNPELFWALRGGGGGTFGVVTSVTYRTHDLVPLAGVFLLSNFTSSAVAKEVASEFFRIQPGLADAGWGGYSGISNERLIAFMISPNVSYADANATFTPFAEFLQSKSNDSGVFTVPFESFYAWYQEFFTSNGQVGGNVELASRLFSRSLYEAEHDKMADVLLSIDGGVALNHVAGGAVSRADPDSVGVNPAWRDAVAHVYATVGWPDGTSAAEIQSFRQQLRGYNDVLEALEPGAGTYLNEASLYESNFRHTFFGSHYDRLLAIKDQYDPSGLFVVPEGVGSERWDESLNCRKGY
ncbi:fad binding domain-containing protein [Moniliophthora roreri MCA 2997]|uniref:Fad binding domain-containing protein n=1 Tax=Moniliophthora roreri (strain MCA 2997) TaxID=1381753 RepID=V2X5G3_MONRO|nr:fad binding domain-containing protein [Moniliophthora roreri MCA 2997]